MASFEGLGDRVAAAFPWKFNARVNHSGSHNRHERSPTLSQIDSCFIERGALCVKRLRQTPVVVLHPWTAHLDEKPKPRLVRKERPDGMKLARNYQALLDSGKFESRAALARHLGVSRARVTQVLARLKE